MKEKPYKQSDGKAPTKAQLTKALWDVWAFADLINFHGGDAKFGECHREFLASYPSDPDERYSIAIVARSHLKSTVRTILRTLHAIYVNPDIRIFIGTRTKDLAKSFLREITQYLQDPLNCEYVWNNRPHIPGRLVPNIGVASKLYSSDDEFLTDDEQVKYKKVVWRGDLGIQVIRSIYSKELTVGIGSTETSATGQHYDVIIFDDIIDFTNYDTPEKIKKVDRWRNDMMNVLDPVRFNEELYDTFRSLKPSNIHLAKLKKSCYVGDEIVVNGTFYYKHDWYHQIIEQEEAEIDYEDDYSRKEFANIKWNILLKNIYKNGRDDTAGYYWKEFWNSNIEARKRRSMDKKTFYAQYLNKVIVESETVLAWENVKSFYGGTDFKLVEDSNGLAEVVTDVGVKKIIRLYLCIDPAATANPKSDETALLVGGVLPDHSLYVADYKLGRFRTSEWIKLMFDLVDKWRLSTIHLEAVGFQVTLVDTIKSYFKEYRPITIREYKPPRNVNGKIGRIESGLQPLLSNGLLYLPPNAFRNARIIDQFNFFPSSTVNDDFLDALEMLREIAKPIGGRNSSGGKTINFIPTNNMWGGLT